MTGALSTSDCGRRTKRRREELPHAQGQGQKPGGPHARRVAAKRSYPTSEVRGIGQVSYPESEAKGRGWEQPPTPEARYVGGEE